MPTLVAAGLSRSEFDVARRTTSGKEDSTAAATTTRRRRRRKDSSHAQQVLAKIARLPGHDKRVAHGDTFQHRLNELAHHPGVDVTLHVLLVLDIVCVAVAMQLQMFFLESKIHDMEEALALDGASDDDHRRWRRNLSEDAHDDGHGGGGGGGHGHEYGNHSLERIEHNVVMVSVAILSVFLAHSLLLIVANGRTFFSHPFAVLDLAVVLVGLVFELVNREGMVVGMIIFVRTFNFIRIGHGIFELEHGEQEDFEEEGEVGNRKYSSDL